jgi:acetamidase/formamidase
VKVHRLARAESRFVHYDWDPARTPVLEISPGDEIIVETRSGEDGQLGPQSRAEDLAGVDWSRLHALTGPVSVRGAEPGDVLAVDTIDLVPDRWGFVMHRPGAGVLKSAARYLRACPIDPDRAVARFGPDLELPLRPMLGVMGVAPATRTGTRAPGRHGGNLDCAALTRGCTLFLPVQVSGALFSCGDGHALQGDGEVCVTGLETAMTAHLRLRLHRERGWTLPRAEDSGSLMVLGSGTTFEDAAAQALTQMLTVLSDLFGLAVADAYALASLVVDIQVNQLVNRCGDQPVVGARATLPKARCGIAGDVWR